jgi:RND family efflux transporter MFP subunit
VQLDDTIVRHNLEKAQAAQDVLREEQQQAKLAVELAQSEVDRLAKLRGEEGRGGGNRTQLVSPVDVQKADYALKDAQSKLKAASGRVLAGSKELASLQAQLKLLSLAAPISGRVGRIQVVRGQTLAVGSLVTEITNLDDQIDVLCYVPPSMIGKFSVGQPAKSGGFDSAESPVAEGQVQFIAEQAESETGNFAVKVRFSNKDVHLKANRVLRIRVRTKPPHECLSLPETAVQEDELPPTVVAVTDIETKKGDEGKEESIGVARRLQVVLGVRDRISHRVEIVRLVDPETDAAKKWKGDIKAALFVVEGGAGLQTGDAVKREE